MEIKISYDEALKSFPEKVKEVICKVEASKSKLKNINPESWHWRISWAVRCGKVIGFDELVNDVKNKIEKKAVIKSLEERIEDYIKRTTAFLRVRSYFVRLEIVPKQIIDYVKPSIIWQIEQEEFIAKQTPEEIAKKIEDSIKMLSKDSGFAMF